MVMYDVIVTYVHQASYWNRNLDMRIADRIYLLENGMLSDRHMYAVNELMAKQFPLLQGLHSTLLAQRASGFPAITLGEYLTEQGLSALQIHFERERHHWIASYCNNREVKLIDSCFTGKLGASAELQLSQLYRCLISTNGLLLTIVPVQQQSPDTNNCGVFCIAAAFHAAVGDNLGELAFAEEDMRPHIAQCIEQEMLTPFPMAPAGSPVPARAPQQTLLIEINCFCQQPDSIGDMVACEQCDRWFHFQCVKLKSAPNSDWFCTDCQ